MVILGITGGIGSGKSVAAEFVRSRGAVIIDGDEVARALMGPGSPLLRKVAEAFGDEVIRPDGSLDRRRLSGMVFGNPEAVARLNALAHPPIMAEIARRLREMADACETRVVCVVAPLLLEVGGRHMVQRLLVMWAEVDERVRRVMARDGVSEGEVRQRIAAQMPAEEQLAGADWVIDTGAGMEATRRQLEQIWGQLVPHGNCAGAAR
jgi:dephospho-CoA kinase